MLSDDSFHLSRFHQALLAHDESVILPKAL
jgi:hypothetical protein